MGGGLVGGGWSKCFYYETKFKIKKNYGGKGGRGGGGHGGGARVSDFFSTKNPKFKKKIFGEEREWGVDEWTDEEAQTNMLLQRLRS